MNVKNVLVLCLSCFSLSSCNLAPGSYPYAELYEVQTNEETLITAIHEFKKKNPEYNTPEEIPLVDGRSNAQDHWYHFYFFDSTNGQVVKTWVRGVGKHNSNFALVAVYNAKFTDRWKFVNKDFDDIENNKIKVRFEHEILDNINEGLR